MKGIIPEIPKNRKETFGNLSTSSLYFWYDCSSVLKYPNNGSRNCLIFETDLFFWSLAMCKKLKDFMITPACCSSRFCARPTYSFSKDDSPANVLMKITAWSGYHWGFWNQKNITIFFFSHREDEILTLRKFNGKRDLPISHLFSCFFFRSR